MNAIEHDFRGVSDSKNFQSKVFLFQTSSFMIKACDEDLNTYSLHHPNQYVAKNFDVKVFSRLTKPFDINVDVDFERFGERCDRMMNDLVIEDENHAKSIQWRECDSLDADKNKKYENKLNCMPLRCELFSKINS